jgi:hypothetical protein
VLEGPSDSSKGKGVISNSDVFELPISPMGPYREKRRDCTGKKDPREVRENGGRINGILISGSPAII